MSFFFNKIFPTLVIIGVACFLLKHVLTHEIDFLSVLKKPLEHYFPIKESAVVVIPAELDFTTSVWDKWDKTEPIEVKNTKAKDTVYSVWIKIKAQPSDYDFTDIEILSDTGQDFISQSVGGINVNFEVVKIAAFDADGQSCIYLLIYKIEGLESKFFKIKRTGSKQGTKKPLTLVLKVIDFLYKPAAMSSKDDAALLQICPPEPLKIKAISCWIKKGS